MQKWIYSLLVLLSFMLYGNSIRNDYNLDDDYVLNRKYIQQGISGIPNILMYRSDVNAEKLTLNDQPVALISYALEYQFFKQAPHISHFTNVLLYAFCLVVLYNILIIVFSLHKTHEWLPFIITILYAVHPIHTDVVDSIKNRDELFGLLFGLLFLKNGYLYFTSTQKRVKFAIYTILFLLLTLFSKSIGFLYFPIFILILSFSRLLRWNKWNYLLLSTCFIISLAGVVILGIKKPLYSFENSLVGISNLSVILPTSLKIILYHIKMLVLPFPLRFYYGHNMFPLQSTFELAVILSFILHTILLVIGIRKMLQKDVVGLLILCYLICLLLYANFPILYPGMFSEKILFLSSIWFIAAIVVMVSRIVNKFQDRFIRYVAIASLLLIFVTYSYQTMRRNFDWHNKLTLMSHDIPYLENSVVANYIYANILYKEIDNTIDSTYARELAEKVIKYYEHVIYLYPYYPDIYYRLARTYRYQLKDLDEAEKQFKNILSVDSNYVGANFELAKIYFDKKDFRSSYPYFKKAYIANPTDSFTLFYYAQNALFVGDLTTCYKINKDFLTLYPDLQYPYLNLGIYYSTILKDDSAVIYLEKAINLGCRNPQLLTEISNYYEKHHDEKKSLYYRNILQQLSSFN